MLIIGHRGARGLKPENTIASLRAGMQAGADMLEFDVRLTRDNVPILSHDQLLWRVYHKRGIVRLLTLAELRKRTAGTAQPVVTLDAALKECAGKIMLNVELKQAHSFEHALPVLKKYITKKSDWKTFIFSSFSAAELKRARKLAPEAQLALLHHFNSLLFVRYAPRLNLAAVGFHRLHINAFTLELAKRLGLFTYAYTVNRPKAALRLAEKGIDGIVTDRPDIMAKNKKLTDW